MDSGLPEPGRRIGEKCKCESTFAIGLLVLDPQAEAYAGIVGDGLPQAVRGIFQGGQTVHIR